MLKEHEGLLEEIQQAEKTARALHAKGARGLEDTVHRLRRAGNDVRERIASYKAQEKAPSSKLQAPEKTQAPSSKAEKAVKE